MSTHKRFQDRDGWTWEAVEHLRALPLLATGPAAHLAGSGALYFLSRFQTRRCDAFPADWARRPIQELVALCEAAAPV